MAVIPPDYFERLEAVELDHWWHRGMWSLTSRLLKQVPAGASVLDAGCGTGGTLRRLQEQGAFGRIVGVDLSEEAITRAAARMPTAELVVAPLDRLPFPDASFDVVVTNDVLQHVPQLELSGSVAELRRVLVPGGLLVVRVNGARKGRRTQADWCIFDRKGVVQLLRENGFTSIELTHVNLVGSLLDLLRRRQPRAPTGKTSGIPTASSSLVSSIATCALRTEAVLRQLGIPTPYGHTLLGSARAAETSDA